MGSTKRISHLDALRAFAILYVVGFWHLSDYSPAFPSFDNDIMLLITDCVLGLFVFVSGILIASRYYLDDSLSVLNFYGRRFFRIYPMFFVALTGYFITNIIPFSLYLKSTFFLNIFLDQNLLTLWFVTMLFVFYGATPLYLCSYSIRKSFYLTIIFFLTLLLIHHFTSFIDARLPKFLIPYVGGVITARNSSHQRILSYKCITWVLLIPLLFITLKINAINNVYARLVMSDLAILLSIPVFWRLGYFFSKNIKEGTIYFLSYSSYAMYLIHRMLFKVAVHVYQPTTLVSSILYLAGFVLTITIALSYLFQLFYDAMLRFLLLHLKTK
jgi:peptidoglycan/LPS O-acetylase OafA/YrhL